MQWWDIGIEGQLYSGAVCSTGAALYLHDLPGFFLIPLMLIVGFVGGGLWGEVAGFLQVTLGINEIISTLMLNYIAIAGRDYFIYGPWTDPAARGFPKTEIFAESAQLPTFPGTQIHLGLLIAIIFAILLGLILNRTRWGFEIQLIGRSKSAARYAGVNIKRNILILAFLSGGLGGLAGMVQVSGVIHKLDRGLSNGIGYTGIIMAFLAQLNAWAVLPVSILFAGFQVGGDYVQFSEGIPSSINMVLQGSLLFFFIIGEALTYYQVKYEKRNV
jgi:general nucleoside transport system permease protein